MNHDPRFAIPTVLVTLGLRSGDSRFISEKFQWLPSDSFANCDGKVILQHAPSIFEQVLSDAIRPLLLIIITTSDSRGWSDEELPIASGMAVFRTEFIEQRGIRRRVGKVTGQAPFQDSRHKGILRWRPRGHGKSYANHCQAREHCSYPGETSLPREKATR